MRDRYHIYTDRERDKLARLHSLVVALMAGGVGAVASAVGDHFTSDQIPLVALGIFGTVWVTCWITFLMAWDIARQGLK